MIFEIIKILAEQVENYIESSITLGNVALIESDPNGGTNLENNILLTMINLSEEVTLKNFPNTKTVGNKVHQKNAIVNLNLYLLFSSNKNQYNQALKDISNIIAFFQGKKIFTQSNTIYNRNNVELSQIDNFRFVVDLYTPTFEELNYIWGSLGGKQIPSVLYKVSIIRIERETTLNQSGLILETDQNLKHKQ